MATPNYSYEKRQRELAKKRKKEEKALRKASGQGPEDADEGAPSGEAPLGAAPAEGAAPAGERAGEP